MKAILAAFFLLLSLLIRPAFAQQDEIVWVQIEAHPSLRTAQERARAYAGQLADVNGFALGGGWYAIALGPYRRADAEQVRSVYRSEGQIPRDSYIAFSRVYRQQFWPIGANVLNRDLPAEAPQVSALPTPPQTPEPETATAPTEPTAEPTAAPDETVAEARQSERALDKEARKDLQIALKAQGFYASSIDGAFGRGTRASMAAWQGANGYKATGVLTSAQRSALIAQYNAPLISVGMAPHQDTSAGIALDLPLKLLSPPRAEAPFVHFDTAQGADPGARVILISQAGDESTLAGLYDILQTLEVIPADGPRTRKSRSFVIEGRNDQILSHSQATLKNGEIKGFTLIWPRNDDARRARVLEAMQNSFARLPGTLDPAAGDPLAQSIDLVSGLKIRKPTWARSGFYVDDTGRVVTSAAQVNACTRVTLDRETEAEILSADPASGIAVLQPKTALAPRAIGQLSNTVGRLQSDIAVSGYSYAGVLSAPTVSYGTLADIRGLNGEEGISRLSLSALDGDAGGPVFDTAGNVLGMLLAKEGAARQLPGDVGFAADATTLRNALIAAGVTLKDSTGKTGALPPEELTQLASAATVLVSCWE